MENAKTRLDTVLSGAATTGLTLPDALKTEIDSMRQSLPENVAKYVLVQRQDEQERLALLEKQKETALFLRRIRQVVGANLPFEEQLAVRRQYGLSEVRFYGQERLLQALSNIIAISEDLEDATLKAVTQAETLAQALQEGLEKGRYFRTQKISFREERVTLVKQFRRLRTKIYAFLMEKMPDGSRDERLIDFGFGPSAMRRRPRSAEEVTVVTEAQTSEIASVVEKVSAE